MVSHLSAMLRQGADPRAGGDPMTSNSFHQTTTDLVRDYLRLGPKWRTLAAIVEATGLTRGQVNGVLYDLAGLGAVELERPAKTGHRSQRYRWRDQF